MSTGVYLPRFLHPKLRGTIARINRRPGHYVEKGEPIVEVTIGDETLVIRSPESGKVMRCREVGHVVAPGDKVTEVTDVGTPTWELFVAYRRADAPGYAGRIGERLIGHFGPGQVFWDLQSLQLGEDFRAMVRKRLQTAFAVVVIIGPQWLAENRLGAEDDLHREEICTALKRGWIDRRLRSLIADGITTSDD